MKLKFVDPIRSMIAKAAVRKPSPNFVYRRKGTNPNPHGIGFPLLGEVRNPTGKGGFADNPPHHVIAARYLASRNGAIKALKQATAMRGTPGIKKMAKTSSRTKEGQSIVKEAREIKEMAARCVPDAIRALHDIIKSEVSSDMAKIAAATTVWDRGYGKPTQTNINATVDPDAKPNQIDDRELERRIGVAIERVENLTKRTREKIAVPERSSELRKLN